MITMRLKVGGKIDGGAMSKSNLPTPTKITVVGNSNSAEAKKKKKDVTEFGAGTDGFLWQAGGDASGKPQE
jgi:hypothetical protein